MKSTFLAILFLLALPAASWSQEKPKLYHPEANAQQEIDAAVARAAKEHKQVFLQIGGNWCKWCIRFHNLVQGNDSLHRLIDDNYVVVHVNYSPENKNEAVLEKLGKPQQFGFPVFVILNSKGKRIHTQNSGDLEQGEGHSPDKVSAFLRQWTVAAVRSAHRKA
jgi:thioredoxin-related protein